MVTWTIVAFDELTNQQLYDIMVLREAAFTQEQSCAEIDLDGLDKDCKHLLGMDKGKIIAYARILPVGVYAENTVSFGRIVVVPDYRKQGVGREAMRHVLSYIETHYPKVPIRFSAQCYLLPFYESLGFETYGEVYDEGGIPHVAMKDVRLG